MEKWVSEVLAYLRSHRQDMVSDLMELVRVPSIAGERVGELPFGQEVDRALRVAARLFEKHGFTVKVSHQSGYALAISEGEGDGIGIFAHCDVVPVNDDWVKTKPFEPIEENGFVYGRGVGDNKSAVIEALYALLALRAAGVPLRKRITVYMGGCEEAGMGDILAFVQQEQMPAVSIVPDGGFPVGIGEKSILRAICRSKDTLCDVVKLDGGEAYNVVLDQVEVALKNEESFRVVGTPAHASRPQKGCNAGGLAVNELLTIPVCEGDKKILSAFAHAISDCFGGNLNIASDGAFGKLTCANGIVRVDKGHLVFSLDIRFGTELDNADCADRLCTCLDALGFTTEITENKPGFLLDENAPELQIILDVCRQVFQKPEAKPIRMSGGTYARYLRKAYSIDSAPGALPADLPKGHGGVHQSDEALSVDAFVQTTLALAVMVARLDLLD